MERKLKSEIKRNIGNERRHSWSRNEQLTVGGMRKKKSQSSSKNESSSIWQNNGAAKFVLPWEVKKKENYFEKSDDNSRKYR
jgi:hypothetical protein